MNAWPISFFTCGCFAGFTSITPYWLNRRRSPSTAIAELAAVLERQPGAAVGERVGVHAGGGVERRPHARAGLAVPGALVLRRCRCPAAFQSSSSAKCVPLLSPREANGAFAARDLLKRLRPRPCRRRPSPGRTSARQDEIVVHHLVAPHAVALGDELLLERPGVHEHHVGVAAPAHVERLAGAERHHAHLDAGLLLEDRQQVLEEARLLGRGGRGDGDEALLRLRPARQATQSSCSKTEP